MDKINNRNNACAYSVLMAVYRKDRPAWLRTAIESMLSQTMRPQQYVIVEDGTLTAMLEAVVKEYESRMPQMFTVVRLGENRGLGHALNQGLRACRNELVARMDADDISKPQRCERQVRAFLKNPKLDILGTQVSEFDERPDNLVLSRVVPCSYKGIRQFAKRRSPFNHPTVMFRKSVVEKMGGYAAYRRKEDLDLFIRMVNQGCYARNLNVALLLYRTGKDSLRRRRSWVNCMEYIQVMHGFYQKGYIGASDMLYVAIGQMVMCFMPECAVEALSRKFLRKKGSFAQVDRRHRCGRDNGADEDGGSADVSL